MSAADGVPEKPPADQLVDAVYDQLRALAAVMLASERPDHTLAPTALVHEAYLRLHKQHSAAGMDKPAFFALAAMMVRRVLVDHARAHHALKRAGGAGRVTLTDESAAVGSAPLDLIALDEALARLEALDPRKSRIVQLRFFGGLTVDEVGAAVNLSPRAVAQEWALARAWLRRELSGGAP